LISCTIKVTDIIINRDQVSQSLVIFDIRALWRSVLSVRVSGCQKFQTTV